LKILAKQRVSIEDIGKKAGSNWRYWQNSGFQLKILAKQRVPIEGIGKTAGSNWRYWQNIGFQLKVLAKQRVLILIGYSQLFVVCQQCTLLFAMQMTALPNTFISTQHVSISTQHVSISTHSTQRIIS
jgi:hypothetical protein